MNEKRYYEDDSVDYLQQLVDLHSLEGAALGITQLVINKGFDSLSDKQKFVFKKEVIEPHTVSKCKICNLEIPWPEMSEATDNGGYCGICANRMEKLKEE